MQKESENGNQMSIQVIERLAQLIEVIATHDEPVTLKILSAETELHTSTAFRILASLVQIGYVERSGDGYVLGTKLISLGRKASGQVDLLKEAHTIMGELRDQIVETINLTIREGDEVVYIDRAIPNRMMRVEQVVGSRAPLHVTAVGKLMLGMSGENAIRNYAQRTGLSQFTDNTLTDINALIDQCIMAVEQGYALDNEEAELGVGCIGVLILGGDQQPIAGLSISAPVDRRSEAWAALLQQASHQISQRLGY